MPSTGTSGFTLPEVLMAMFVLGVVSLGLGSAMTVSALTNKRAYLRQQATDAVAARIDELQSLDYDDVGMLTADSDSGTAGVQDPACPASTCAAAIDDRTRNATDWAAYCPRFVKAAGGCSGSRLVVVDDNQISGTDPRQAKTSARGTAAQNQANNTSVRRAGLVLYTYITWRDAGRRDYKLVTVVARWRDPKAAESLSDRLKNSTVTATTVISPTPNLRYSDRS